MKMRLRNYYLDAEAGKKPSRQSTRQKTKPWFKVTANKNWETFVLMGWSLWMVVMLIPLRNPWKMHSLARKCAWTKLKIQTVWVQMKYRGCLDCDSPIKGGAEDMGSRLIAKYTQIFVVYLSVSQSAQERAISSGSRRQSHKEKNRCGWYIRHFISLRYLLVNKLETNNCQLCFVMKIQTSAVKREILNRK